MSFHDKLENIVQDKNTLLCIGLDSDFDKLPQHLKTVENPLFEFNKAIIDSTQDLVCAYKINSAFYEAQGDGGIRQLKMTCDYLRTMYPTIPIILDFKRGDVSHTNLGYVKFAYDYLGVDAVTLNPYMGSDALRSFLNIGDKGCIFICKTSNEGSGEIQNLMVGEEALYRVIARKAAIEWNQAGNCYLVMGATHPEELTEIRSIVHDLTLLIPGVGTQGGSLEQIVKAGVNSKNRGLIISMSRNIIFVSDDEFFAKNARKAAESIRNDINTYRGTTQLDKTVQPAAETTEERKEGEEQSAPQEQQNQTQETAPATPQAEAVTQEANSNTPANQPDAPTQSPDPQPVAETETKPASFSEMIKAMNEQNITKPHTDEPKEDTEQIQPTEPPTGQKLFSDLVKMAKGSGE